MGDDILYHPRYCEENVWHLCQAPQLATADAHVVVVSNPGRRVAMWMQQAARPDEPIGWDYHVIVVARTDGWQVWDLDTRLGMPIGAERYLELTFATVGVQPVRFDPLFRVIPAATYRDQLRSDRSHMRREDGSWHAPPPPWPLITDAADGSNLESFVDVTRDERGPVIDLTSLRRRFS